MLIKQIYKSSNFSRDLKYLFDDYCYLDLLFMNNFLLLYIDCIYEKNIPTWYRAIFQLELISPLYLFVDFCYGFLSTAGLCVAKFISLQLQRIFAASCHCFLWVLSTCGLLQLLRRFLCTPSASLQVSARIHSRIRIRIRISACFRMLFASFGAVRTFFF